MTILLHLIMDAKTARQAKPTATAALAGIRELAPGCRIKAFPTKPYWKIAGNFEFGFQIVPSQKKQAKEIQRALAAGLADGWDWFPNGNEAVWNAEKKRQFKFPAVNWAHIDLAS